MITKSPGHGTSAHANPHRLVIRLRAGHGAPARRRARWHHQFKLRALERSVRLHRGVHLSAHHAQNRQDALAERNCGKRPRYGEVALGLSAGLSTLAFVLLIQVALGVLRITPSAEAAPLQIHNCVIWAQCFLITGLCEEAVFRGYLLGTLQKGLGFWPATAISSVLFAVVHLPNYGERASGIFACVLFSVLFALTVRLTGTIWFAVGFHAAWDWSQP